jgi:hypothetical protein
MGLTGDWYGMLFGWANTGIIIVLLLALGAIGILGGLYLRKRGKLNRPVIEMIDLGNGFYEFIQTKGGWFKKRFTFGGLWDYGNEKAFRLKDGTIVPEVTHNDYRIINGKKGLIVIRDPLDPKFAFPVSRFNLDKDSKMLMGNIASADLRDAAVTAIEQADAEMQMKWEKIMPYIAAGLILISIVIVVILMTQYGSHMVDKSSETLKYATDAVTQIGSNAAAKASTIAP